MNRKFKIVLAGVLVLFTALMIWLYLSSSDETNEKDPERKPVTKDEFTHDIDSIISGFGIKREWMKDISANDRVKSKLPEDIWLGKNVFIPNDLPVIELNHELSKYLSSNDLIPKVSEDQRTKNLSMTIHKSTDSAKKIISALNFIYSDTVKRDAALVAIVLDSIDAYSIDDVQQMFGSNLEYSVVLPLRNDKSDYQSAVIESKKDHLLFLEIGNEDNIDADFKEDMKESLWKSKVRSLSLNFPNASGVILTGSGVSNEFIRSVADEFLKYNLRVYRDNMFLPVKNSPDRIDDLTENIREHSGMGKTFLYYRINVGPSEFTKLDSSLDDLKRRGYKFVSFGEIVKRISRQSQTPDSLSSKK